MVVDTELEELLQVEAELDEYELLEARDRLAVYCGLHIPAEIERDDLPALHEKPIAARYIPAQHHQIELEHLELLESREIKRLMILAPPGSAKSTYGSVMFPAWYMGRHPTHGVIQGSAVEELATRFSRRARNTVASDVHMSVFGSGVSPGSKAAGEWTTVEGGEYYATGTTSFAGRRADLVVLDDIIRGRKDADSKTVRESVWQWYIGDIRPRMKPNAVLLYICTRWHEDDPAGRILPAEAFGKSGMFRAKDGEMWCVLNLVAVVETKEEQANDPLKRALGEIIWPEWFTVDMLAQERKTQGNRNWNALYQQKPRPDEGAILKKTFWRQWPDNLSLPKCEFVLSCYDTAFETKEENDYSARTTWGVFWHEELPPAPDEPKPKWYSRQVAGRWCAIILERWKDKVEFPELRKLAKEDFMKQQQNRILVEKKASGHSLIQELRRSNVPVHEIEVDRDKVVRAHAAAVTLEDGAIWHPDRRWAEDVIDECASFPNGEHDDLVDTVVHAINYMRQHFFLQTKDQIGQAEDEEEEDAQRQSNESRGRLF